MRILFLAPANNYHTKKWVRYFVSRDYEVHVISLTTGMIEGAQIHLLNTSAGTDDSDFKKLSYLSCVKNVGDLVKTIEPDIISVHYASSYGSLAAFALRQKYALSVWGSDVYSFPNKSAFHKALLKLNLQRASLLMSTSYAMANELKLYSSKEAYITPFGVDTEFFSPSKRQRSSAKFVFGNIKSLSPEYGIDTLIEAAAVLKHKRPDIDFEVRIGGKGPLEIEYKNLAKSLGIDDNIIWLGFISQTQVANEWANFDVAVISSNQESFGVSALEAQACGIPVIISDIDGLKEATNPGVSSLVVKKGDSATIADYLIKFYEDRELASSMGMRGREYVLKHFELNTCFKAIENVLLKVTKD